MRPRSGERGNTGNINDIYAPNGLQWGCAQMSAETNLDGYSYSYITKLQ
jgi:hypothetical protein